MVDAVSPNTNADFREQLRRYEERMHPRHELHFNGSKLTLKENGKPIVSWPGVSGRAGRSTSPIETVGHCHRAAIAPT